MGAEVEPIVDPQLVDVLSRYVTERCPDEFALYIYDRSSPQEYRAHMGRPFEPAIYDGIDIEILDEPSHDDLVRHLEEGRSGIVGAGAMPDDNRFAVTRSFSAAATAGGWPVDLVSTDPDRFGSGAVWETVIREQDGLWGFPCPEWTPFETMIILVPAEEVSTAGTTGVPGGQSIPGDEAAGTPSGEGDAASTDSGEGADLEIEMRFDAPVAAGSEERHLLYIWNNGPGIARGAQVDLWYPDTVGYVSSSEGTFYPGYGLVESEQRLVTAWQLGDLFVNPSAVVGYLGAEIISVRLSFDPSLCGETVAFVYEIRGDTPDPNMSNNAGVLRVPVLPCGEVSEPEGAKPNLWVTDVSGCWKLTGRWEITETGDEGQICAATVFGIVHNGGQADAESVQVWISACGDRRLVSVGTIPAGGEKDSSVRPW